MTPVPETFFALVRRHTADPDDPPEIHRVGLAASLQQGRAPFDILNYLAGLGRPVSTLDALFEAINGDETEEELGAFRVAEGVAVSVASDGAWVLFEP